MLPRISPKLQLIASGVMVQGLRVATTLVMARWVSKEDYGAYMLVVALPALVAGIGDFGIPTTLVQLKNASEEAIVQTATVLGAGLYLVYGTITVSGGAYLAYVRDDYRLLAVAGILAVSNLLTELYNIQLGVLNRRLAFRAEARQNVIASVATGTAGVAFALSGLGVFALALQVLAGQLVANLSMLRTAPLAWPRHFSRDVARSYFRLGTKVTFAAYMANVQVNILNLLMNHLGGTAILGAWGRAVTVAQLCGANVLASFERVVYPLLCKAADDADYRRALFVRSTLLLMLPAAFATAWLIVGREPVVRLVLGPQWGAVPPMLVIAALSIPAAVFYSMGYRTAYALGRTGLMLRAGVVDLALFVPVVAGLWRFGVMGIAAAWVVSRVLSATLLVAGVWRDVRPPVGKLASGIGLLWAAAAASGGVLFMADRWLAGAAPGAPLLIRFGAASLAALAAYAGLVMLVLPDVPRTVWILSRGGADAGADASDRPAPPPPEAGTGPAGEAYLATGDAQALVAREQRA